MSDKLNNFFTKFKQNIHENPDLQNFQNKLDTVGQDLKKNLSNAANAVKEVTLENPENQQSSNPHPNPHSNPSASILYEETNKKIQVNETYFNNLLSQNEQLNNKIQSQEDDFNLQYSTFQNELKSLGDKICILENERKTYFDQNTELKHLLASQKEESKNKAKKEKKDRDKDSKNSENTETANGDSRASSDTESETEEEDENSEATKATKIVNEFDNEIKSLRKQNTEKQTIINKLMAESMKSESENFNKIERLVSELQQKDQLIQNLQNCSQELTNTKNLNQKLQEELDTSNELLSKLKIENHHLIELADERKESLDKMAIDHQKLIQSKNSEIEAKISDIKKLNQKLDQATQDILELNKNISTSQKQDWHKSREIDSLVEKIATKDKEIKGLYEQRNILESDLDKVEKDLEKNIAENKSFIESIRSNLESKLKSLENQLNESLEHNKRLANDLKKRDEMISELKTTSKSRTSSFNSEKSSISTIHKNELQQANELKEAIQRALTAEKKMAILQKDLGRQLSLEKRRCKNLSDKLARHTSNTSTNSSNAGRTHHASSGLAVGSSICKTNKSCSGSTTGSIGSVKSGNFQLEISGNIEEELKLKIKQLEKDLENALIKANTQNYQVTAGGTSSGSHNNVNRKHSIAKTNDTHLSFPGSHSQLSESSYSSHNKQVVENSEPHLGVDYKAINQQLSSLLEDEMMKNKCLRDNIVDLTEQLAAMGNEE